MHNEKVFSVRFEGDDEQAQSCAGALQNVGARWEQLSM